MKEPLEKVPFLEWSALAVLAAMLVLDAPWGRAFYSYDPFTETLGHYFFSSISKSFSIPGLSFSLFEVMSIGLAVAAWMQSRARKPNETHDLKSPWVYSLWSIPVMVAFGIVVGIAQGNSFGTALTQTRSMASAPIWMVIGFALGSPSMFLRLSKIVFFTTTIKALQGLWCYVYVLGRSKGRQEYLIEHVTSDVILTGLSAALVLYVLQGKSVSRSAYLTVSAAAMTTVFLLNDRRSAMVGAVLGLGGVLASLKKDVIYRYSMQGMLVLALTVFYTAATWGMRGPLGFPSRAIVSLFDPDE
ncbi:hypothetical protein E3A20_29130, partial [Planctomyces bekefii]